MRKNINRLINTWRDYFFFRSNRFPSSNQCQIKAFRYFFSSLKCDTRLSVSIIFSSSYYQKVIYDVELIRDFSFWFGIPFGIIAAEMEMVKHLHSYTNTIHRRDRERETKNDDQGTHVCTNLSPTSGFLSLFLFLFSPHSFT